MALNRVRARLRFTNGSGMAAWCLANMGVRLTQAISINEGKLNEELKVNKVTADGSSHSIYECDLPLLNQSHAVDAFNTLNSISAWIVPFDDPEVFSFIERHTCYHDEMINKPCKVDQKQVF